MDILISLPDTLSFESRGVIVTRATADFPADILSRMLMDYQGVMDSASGASAQAAIAALGESEAMDGTKMTPKAKAWAATDAGKAAITDATKAAMDNKVKALVEGKWTVRTAGAAYSDKDQAIVRIIGRLVKDKKAWTAMSYAEKAKAAAAQFTANAAKLEPLVAPEIAAMEAERKAREDRKASAAALANNITITI